MSRLVGIKATRKLEAQRDIPVWPGLSVMGLIGWSIVVPTLFGAALGRWLDSRYPMTFSWTLTSIILGLGLGCWNAWHWVVKTGHEMETPAEGNDD